MSKHVCILGAVTDEIAGVKQRMHIEHRHVFDGVPVLEGHWEGYSLLLARTGIGGRRARRALQQIMDRFELVLAVSMGYAGATDPDLRVGDLVLADRVLQKSLPRTTGVSPAAAGDARVLDSALINQAMILSCPPGPVLHRGGLLTVDRVVTQPREKRELGAACSVSAIDMETFDLVTSAQEGGVPILSVRAISDAADQELADLTHLVRENGEVNPLKAGWHVLTHPHDIKQALHLREQTRLATRNLTEFLAQYLRHLQ
ncbi:MAG: hypothetical protein ACE5ER_11105 [Nitrospinaceae bacterium]